MSCFPRMIRKEVGGRLLLPTRASLIELDFLRKLDFNGKSIN